MTLSELIKFLKKHDQSTVVPLGFGSPHSYRVYYDELAFEPREDTTVGEMLDSAEQALGATYMGYKGGEFTMCEHTNVWLARYGSSGESIGITLLRYMVKDL